MGPGRGSPLVGRAGPGEGGGAAVPARVKPSAGQGAGLAGCTMELRILELRVRVLSLARRGLWLYTHPLLKMLLLPQRSR